MHPSSSDVPLPVDLIELGTHNRLMRRTRELSKIRYQKVNESPLALQPEQLVLWGISVDNDMGTGAAECQLSINRQTGVRTLPLGNVRSRSAAQQSTPSNTFANRHHGYVGVLKFHY